jgi:hypothetical protein
MRGRIIILALLLLLPPPPREYTEIKDCPDTGYARNYFTQNLAAKIKGETINDDRTAEKGQPNSIIE